MLPLKLPRLVLGVCLVAGCTSRSPGVSVGSPVAAATPIPAATFSSITFERRPCFGMCPVYLVTVNGDGSMIFDGRANVDSARRVTARLDAQQLASLARAFQEAQYFTLDDRYTRGMANCPNYFADAPVIITSYASRDGSKQVEHDLGCGRDVPARLSDLERRIEEIIGTSRWIGRR